MSRLPPLLALLAATLLLMAAAFADGRPTVFYDSHSYDVMGRDLIEEVRDYPASTQNKFLTHRQMGDWPVPADKLVDPNVEGARSWFYGVFLHGMHLIGSLWLLAAVQSFLAAWIIHLLWRTLAPKAPAWSYLAVVAGAVAGTSVSFFTTFAMPDIFAGIGGAAVVLVLTQSDRLKRLEIAGLWAICVYAMAVHRSHWGTEIVVALGGGLLTVLLGLSPTLAFARVMVVLSAAVAAWGAGVVADGVYQARTGYRLGHPPFIMARMLADGPGKAYMMYACAHGEDYALCKFKDNVRPSTDLILWSDKKKYGVFNVANLATRVRLEREEMRFVTGVMKFDPLGQTWASLQNWGEQFVAYQVDDPLRNPAAYLRGRYWPTTMLPKLIPNFQACRPPGNCRPPFNYEALSAWHGLVLGASLLLLAWRLCWRDVRLAVIGRGLKSGDDEPARVGATILLLLAVAIVNAAICGVLSGPFARYQSRLIWLLPVGAGIMACALPMGLSSVAEKAKRIVAAVWLWGLAFWEKLRALPAIGRFLPALDGHFSRFCCVGGLGFLVDFGVLKIMVHAGLDPITGRWISFSVALMATWLTNRAWTFRNQGGPKRSILKEFGAYLAVQSVGFAANFTVYSAMVKGLPMLEGRLLPPMIAATCAGLVINFLGAKHFVYRKARPS